MTPFGIAQGFQPDYTGLARALLPEIFLIGGALVVLGLDLAFFATGGSLF